MGAAALTPSWRERPATYPLMLISPASDKRISSTLGDLAGSRKAPKLMMNSRDAEQRCLARGGEVRVWNELGEVILPLEVTDDVPPGARRQREGNLAFDQPDWADNIGAGFRRHARRSCGRRMLNDTRVEVGSA